MTDLNTQYAAWLEKNADLFRKWQNSISPPPAQESPGDFRDEERNPRELKKHKQPWPHNHWDNVKSPLPTGKYLGPGGSQHMKKGGPGSGRKKTFGQFDELDRKKKGKTYWERQSEYLNDPENIQRALEAKQRRDAKKQLRHAAYEQKYGKPYFEPVKNTRKEIRELKKGGPGSGRKLGSKNTGKRELVASTEYGNKYYITPTKVGGYRAHVILDGKNVRTDNFSDRASAHAWATGRAKRFGSETAKIHVEKGLRGPKKGSTYRKQGAKFFEDVEPRREKNLPPAVQHAMSQYKITRQPQDYQKIVSEMRRMEPQQKYWEQETKEIKHPVLNALLRKRLMKVLQSR